MRQIHVPFVRVFRPLRLRVEQNSPHKLRIRKPRLSPRLHSRAFFCCLRLNNKSLIFISLNSKIRLKKFCLSGFLMFSCSECVFNPTKFLLTKKNQSLSFNQCDAVTHTRSQHSELLAKLLQPI